MATPHVGDRLPTGVRPPPKRSAAPHLRTCLDPSVDSQLQFSDDPCYVSTLGSIAVVAGVAVAVCGVVIRFRRARWIGFADKTLWDWLQLMVIPPVLAGVAFALNAFQNDRDQSPTSQISSRISNTVATANLHSQWRG